MIKSAFRQAVADCETIFFPVPTKVGLKCFRVDLGKLFRWDGSDWKEIPVPVGKFWFNPHSKQMMIYRKSGWKSLASMQRTREEIADSQGN